jgi:hypothetical protein
MEIFTSICLGLALSACCGFRVFVPGLVACSASLLGWHHFPPDFAWMGTWTAFYLLATATALEITAFYIPWLDNVLDHVALPAAAVAGTLLATSFFGELPVAAKWALGAILGGGGASLIHAGTGLLRLGSTAATGGLGNPVLATAENFSAAGLSLLAFVVPVLVALLMGGLLIWASGKVYRKFYRRV